MYTYNEKDYCGKTSDSTAKGKSAVNEAYRKMFPSYNLEVTEGLYQSFKVGGVLFIVTDSRTFLSIPNKTFFGETQKTWIKNMITTAATDATIRGVIVTSTQVWNYNATAYIEDMVQQDYISINEAFNAEKKEIGDALINSGMNYLNPTGTNYKPFMMTIGEQMLAFDNGLNNQETGKFPVLVCGGVEESGSCKGGPYSSAYFSQSTQQYCNVTVITNFTDPINPKLCFISQAGYVKDDNTDEMTFVYNSCYPEQFKDFNRKCPIGAYEKLVNFALTLGINILLFVVFFILLYKLSTKAFNFNTLDPNAEKPHVE